MDNLREMRVDPQDYFQQASNYHAIPTEEGKEIARMASMLSEIDAMEQGQMGVIPAEQTMAVMAAMTAGIQDGQNRSNPNYKSKFHAFANYPFPKSNIDFPKRKKNPQVSSRNFLYMGDIPENKLPVFLRHSCRDNPR